MSAPMTAMPRVQRNARGVNRFISAPDEEAALGKITEPTELGKYQTSSARRVDTLYIPTLDAPKKILTMKKSRR